jgi:hypothetical protein
MSYTVASAEEVATLRAQVDELKTLVLQMKAAQPEWVREEEARRLTGLSQSTLSRERRKHTTPLVWKTEGGLRYLRSSLDTLNELRSVSRYQAKEAA